MLNSITVLVLQEIPAFLAWNWNLSNFASVTFFLNVHRFKLGKKSSLYRFIC